MASQSSSSENLKEAVSAATRALAQDPELEISFGGVPSSGSNLVISNPPIYTHIIVLCINLKGLFHDSVF